MKAWQKKDEDFLRANWLKKSRAELMEALPNYNWDSIQHKATRMRMPAKPREKKANGIEQVTKTVQEVILDTLQRTTLPIPMENLQDAIVRFHLGKLSFGFIEREMDTLIADGFDIKTITSGGKKLYTLIRFAEAETSDFYRVLGEVRCPLLLTGDWHIGSKGFSEQAYREMLRDIELYGIKDIMMPGDMLQGRGVYRQELNDLLYPDITKQVDLAIGYLKELPKDVRIHVTMGNHEEKIKGSVMVGYDTLRDIANQVPQMTYYGSVAKFAVRANGKSYTLLQMHTSGGPSYARSYKPQKMFDSLKERPDILVTGNLHVLSAFPYPGNKQIFQVGTLQRENAYLIWKGLTPQVGWVILLEYDAHTATVKFREPPLY